MKTTLLAAAFAVIGTPMLAEGLRFGGEATNEYNLDTEQMTVTLTPEITYQFGQMDFTASSELSLYDSNAVDHFTATNLLDSGSRPDLDFGVTYYLQGGLKVYAETGWDIDAQERKDIVVGTTFAF